MELISHILSGGLGWLIIPALVYASMKISRNNRSSNRNLHNPQRPNPYLNQNQQQVQPPYIAPGPPQNYAPPPPTNPYNYGPGYPGPFVPPTQPGYYPNQPQQGWAQPPAPMPGYYPNPNQQQGWSSPPPPQAAWPQPQLQPSNPEARIVPVAPGTQSANPNLPTKDVFVWGRTLAGWTYGGKLTVAKSLAEREIRQYAEGKFGPDLHDKLCIEADNFEQARYIFEQSRTF